MTPPTPTVGLGLRDFHIGHQPLGIFYTIKSFGSKIDYCWSAKFGKFLDPPFTSVRTSFLWKTPLICGVALGEEKR